MKAEKSYYQAVEIFDSFSKGDECDNRDLCIDIIELYINELSDSDVEELCDNLRVGLDGYSYKDNSIGFHIGFESQYLTRQNEQDLVMRRVTFIERIF